MERLRGNVFDGWQRLMPRERVADRVVVVVIDEKALARHGQWPWPRWLVADLVSGIARTQPLVVALDIFFPEPDRHSPAAMAGRVAKLSPELASILGAMPSNDALLGSALAAVPAVLGVAGLESSDPRFAGPPPAAPVRFLGGAEAGLPSYPGHLRSVPEVEAAARGHGLYSVRLEGGVARRLPMLARFDGATVASLSVEMIRVALEARLTVAPAAGGLIELRFGDYVVPLQRDGHAYLHYGRSAPGNFVSAADVLDGTVDPARLSDKLVLVGFTGLGLIDLVATPLGETVFGVENHAQAAEAILEGRFLRRISAAALVEAAVLVVFAAGLFVLVPRAKAQHSAAVVLAGVIVLFGAAAAAFAGPGLLFDPVLPSLGALLVFGVMQAGSFAEAQHQRQELREQAARMAGEMSAAKRIQMGLLPDPRTVLEAERRVDVAALLEPARTVGGDFYDCFALDGRHLFFVVADVSGKGLPAALFMASAKSILKSAVMSRPQSLGEALARAQEELRRENPEALFVTACAGLLDLESGELELANAGHEPAWSHPPRGRPERLESAGGPPLCVLDAFDYPSTRRRLASGEWLLVLSDGVTEAMNGRGEFFGVERLRTSLAWLGDAADAESIVRRVSEDVRRFVGDAEPADDLTLLAIRWTGRAG